MQRLPGRRISTPSLLALGGLLLCLWASAPVIAADRTVRVATFNVAMGLDEPGDLGQRLVSGEDQRLRQLAEILQRIRPDILLLNEFDHEPSVDAATLLQHNYLSASQQGLEPIEYTHVFSAPVNTGIDSGLDLNDNGLRHEAADAFGYGSFPGQYGMLVLSRFPIDENHARTFQKLAWKDLPNAQRPMKVTGEPYWPDETWEQLRLSSKSHWDVPIMLDEQTQLHLLASHPTPPVFDGPEDRNGLRNSDEIRFWFEYLFATDSRWIRDDQGRAGGLGTRNPWVIAGDLNADPVDGDNAPGGTDRFMDSAKVNSSCVPASEGAVEASTSQAGANTAHRGNPAQDTADFNDRYTGNLRADFLLTGSTTTIVDCGVYWPAEGQAGHELINLSDHRLVWMDLKL